HRGGRGAPGDGAVAGLGRPGGDARERRGEHGGDRPVPLDRAGPGRPRGPRGRLTQWMSAYYLVGYAAAGLGALAVAASTGRGAPAGVAPYGLLFWVFAASGALQAALYAQLPPTPPRQPERAGGRLPSSGLIYRIAVLFALDSFAGGFVLQSLMVYWLHVRFDLSAAALGSVFFGTQVLTVCSLLIAASAARHLGLVNTMVFSHLASNVLLILMGL